MLHSPLASSSEASGLLMGRWSDYAALTVAVRYWSLGLP
jgi:hypothetical protein